MAHLVYTGICPIVVYDWRATCDISKLTRQEIYKRCVIELDEMHRNGQQVPAPYDEIVDLIEDEEFKTKYRYLIK